MKPKEKYTKGRKIETARNILESIDGEVSIDSVRKIISSLGYRGDCAHFNMVNGVNRINLRRAVEGIGRDTEWVMVIGLVEEGK